MNYLGLLTLLTVYFIIDCFIVNKRSLWIVPILWTIPVFGMVFNYEEGMEINGLLVLICYFMIFISIKSLWGIKMWNTKNRKFHYITFIFLYMIVFALTYYVFYEASSSKFIPSFSFIKSASLKHFADTSLWALVSIIFTFPVYNFIDKTFGKKSDLIIICCKSYSSNIFYGTLFSRYYIEGIHNGRQHPFEISKRMFFILRKERTLELKIKKGILGGIYVFENPCPNLERKARRRDRKIARFSLLFFIMTVVAGIYFFILY